MYVRTVFSDGWDRGGVSVRANEQLLPYSNSETHNNPPNNDITVHHNYNVSLWTSPDAISVDTAQAYLWENQVCVAACSQQMVTQSQKRSDVKKKKSSYNPYFCVNIGLHDSVYVRRVTWRKQHSENYHPTAVSLQLYGGFSAYLSSMVLQPAATQLFCFIPLVLISAIFILSRQLSFAKKGFKNLL